MHKNEPATFGTSVKIGQAVDARNRLEINAVRNTYGHPFERFAKIEDSP